MTLDNFYYRIKDEERAADGQHAVFHIELLPDCPIYRGHFPGKPVCPGVCHIEVIRECAERLMGKERRIRMVKRCRLTAVASPTVCPQQIVAVQVASADNGFQVTGSIADGEKTYAQVDLWMSD